MTVTTSDRPQQVPRPRVAGLDRTLDLAAITWESLAWVAILLVALGLRVVQLGGWALAPAEARHAYDAWLLLRGNPAGDAIGQTGPLFLLLESLFLFLFGPTDVVVRLVPALAGLLVVALCLPLRDPIGRPAALGMAALAAISPTLVYLSRVAVPASLLAVLSLALVLVVARAGLAPRPNPRAAVAAGVLIGCLFATGPAGLTVLVSLAAGAGAVLLLNAESAVRRGILALAGGRALLPLLAGLAVTVVVLFTRFFSDPLAIAGVGRTFGEWWQLLFVGPATPAVPVQFALLAALLYEPLAVLGAVIAALGFAMPGVRRFGGAFLGGWAVAALLLWSFAAGRAPEDAAAVALPLVLLGGATLGEAMARLRWADLWRGPGGILAAIVLGLILAVAAVAILLSSPPPGVTGIYAALPAVVITMLVVVPLIYGGWLLSRAERAAGQPGQTWLIVLLVATVLLGGYSLRSAIMLSLYRGNTGVELLAQEVASGAVRPTVDRLLRLARDATVTTASAQDPTGGHGLVMAAEESVQWPFRWYFRDFPSFSVVPDGTAATTGADVVFGQDEAAQTAAGYRPQLVPWLTNVPAIYAEPDIASHVGNAINPTRWLSDSRFLFYREGVPPPGYTPVAVGLDAELAGRIAIETGPYSLADRPGPGSGEGQFNQPVGVAVGPDGTIYVVDQGNSRVQLFAADGEFRAIWGAGETGVDLARTPNGLGPTGIATDDQGNVYVADTWNHRVVVLDRAGTELRTIGGAPDPSGVRVAADTTDDPALVTTQPGAFFGPRDVVVANGEIYVVDTGNERVQVFGPDGAFRRVWGGYGSGPGQFIEPVGIAVDAAGTVYVADSGNARISLFTPAGEAVAQWPVPAWPPKDPTGARPAFQPYLAFGPDGNLYATSADTGSVEMLSPQGEPLSAIRVANGAPLQRPTGIAAAPDGDLWITDIAANAVLRYTPPLVPALDLPLLPAIEGAASPTAASPGAGEAGSPVASPLAAGSPPAVEQGQAGGASGTLPAPPRLRD